MPITCLLTTLLRDVNNLKLLDKILSKMVLLGIQFSCKTNLETHTTSVYIDCDCEGTFQSYKRQIVKEIKHPL